MSLSPQSRGSDASSSNRSRVPGVEVRMPGTKTDRDSPTGDSSTMVIDIEQSIEPLDPPQPVSLRYDLSVSVEDFKTKEPRLLLQDAAGKAEPGDLVAVIGPSGSGKTTLLKVLTGRVSGYEGTVLLNDQPPSMATRGVLCFVEQEDLFIPSVTPREHLLFTATLKMENTTYDERARTVNGLLAELGLESCADTPIGEEASMIQGRISGGEKKRLSLATELLSRPSVIFADEVTSGLDSFMAETVVMKLKQLAETGHTVLVSIHQPSSYVFSAFSHIHLLSNGRTAFTGKTRDAVEYFNSIGRPLPARTNPADFYMKLLSNEERDELLDAWSQAPATQELHLETTQKQSRVDMLLKKSNFAASWFTQLTELMGRTVLGYRRDATLGRLRLAQSIFVALLVGLVYLNIGRPPIDTERIQSVNGSLFFAIMNQGILGSVGVIQVFPAEKPVFRRESSANTYSVSAYVISRFMAEGGFNVAIPMVFSTIYYFLIGFGSYGVATFFEFSLFIVLTSMAAISFGYFVGSIASSVQSALALGPMLLMPLVIFAGFFYNVDTIDPWFIWISYISFVRYGFEGIMITMWGTQGALGDAVLGAYAFDPVNKWRNVGLLCVLILAYRGLSWIFLKIWIVNSTKSKSQ